VPTYATTDLCDAHPDIQVCDPVFQAFGGAATFSGAIATLKVFEDNTLIKQALESPGDGRVLVVDGGGSKRCGLVGGNLAVAAAANGWAGIVVHGCIRDVDELAQQPVGVRALAAFPRKSERGLHTGQAGRPVVFASVTFHEGAWLAADADGVVVLPEAPASA
jgi:regulator of ribonuclease activity A